MTGLLLYEEGITGKWLAMLKEVTHVARAALIASPSTTLYVYFVRAAQSVASSLAIELVPAPIKNAADIERVIALARVSQRWTLVLPSATFAAARSCHCACRSPPVTGSVHAASVCRGRRSDVVRYRFSGINGRRHPM